MKFKIIAVPLVGGLTLGAASFVFLFELEGGLPGFFLFFLIGALLSMLVCWPVLWLVERFLTTPWRYVIGGAGGAVLIWLACIAPIIREGTTAVLPPAFWLGPLVFISIGVVAGSLYTAINCWYERRPDVQA